MPNRHTPFFFFDIAGYSKMVEHDEKLAFRLLQENNRIIEKSVTENEGRIVKYIGDSVFAEFKTPESALLLISDPCTLSSAILS
jgi:class 3 adenylate cyclase